MAQSPDTNARNAQSRELSSAEAEASRAGAEFLITDLGIAHALLDLARQESDAVVRRRYFGHAWRAYDTVLRLSRRLQLEPEERRDLERGVLRLRARLDDEAEGRSELDPPPD
jgi:hypothetical protein